MRLVLAAQLRDPGQMVARHHEDEVGCFDQLAREQAGPVGAQVESILQPDQVGAFGDRRSIPRAGAGGGHVT